MSIGIVKATEVWSEPADTLDLRLLDNDGDFAHLYRPEGPWEVDITSDTRFGEDEARLLIPLAFGSKEQGQRAAQVLAEAFATVRKIQAEAAPDPEACEHKPVAMRFSRKLGQVWICERCTSHLGEVEA